jgi:hypothetical protein
MNSPQEVRPDSAQVQDICNFPSKSLVGHDYFTWSPTALDVFMPRQAFVHIAVSDLLMASTPFGTVHGAASLCYLPHCKAENTSSLADGKDYEGTIRVVPKCPAKRIAVRRVQDFSLIYSF